MTHDHPPTMPDNVRTTQTLLRQITGAQVDATHDKRHGWRYVITLTGEQAAVGISIFDSLAHLRSRMNAAMERG